MALCGWGLLNRPLPQIVVLNDFNVQARRCPKVKKQQFLGLKMYWASTMALCGWGPLNRPLPQIVVSDLEQLQGLVVVQKSKNGNFCV